MKPRLSRLARGALVGLGATAAGYAGLVAWHRLRYGRPGHFDKVGGDVLLDRYIASPEVVEHHHIEIDAPAEVVLDAAKAMRLLDSPLVRSIFKARELVLGGQPDKRGHPQALFEQMQSIGWVMLAERPGRELVMGAATIPWHANPVFRSVPAGEFAAFREPGYVKIA